MRTVELKKKTNGLSAALQRANRPNAPATPGEDKDRPGLIEKLEAAQVEVQLLQLQANMYQQELNEALNNLCGPNSPPASTRPSGKKRTRLAARSSTASARNM